MTATSSCCTRSFAISLLKRRQGTHAVKNRSAVSGGGKKPYRQKGTGRARQGTTRAPHYRGGGRAFGPTPRSYSFKLPKKVRANALRSALSDRVTSGRFFVLDKLEFPEAKTRDFAKFLASFEVEGALVLIAGSDTNTELSARNLVGTTVQTVDGVNVYDLLRHKATFATRDAVQQIRERFGA